MANKEALRELQARLAERLQAVRTQARSASWLAVECAGHGFLLPLHEAGEIFALAPIVAVAHVQPWFLGVANLRGHLNGIVDLAAFLGLGLGFGRPEALRDESRLVAFNAALDTNCALLVGRLAGLRSAEQLVPVPAAGSVPAFVGDRWRDAAGRHWQELRLGALAREDTFLTIVG